MQIVYLASCFLLLFSSWPALSDALDESSFVQHMVETHQFDRQQLRQWLKNARVRKSILKVMQRPAGKVKPWYEYRQIFITEPRINSGAKFYRQHSTTLARAQKAYGVPEEIITAIIGVETSYGQVTGKFRVLDALYTLAFNYPRRAEYFQQELEQFFLLCREEDFKPTEPKGSYAGAMGLGQFMPSSFHKFAVDFDGDGHRNIWTSEADAIGSIANYLHSYGWQPNGLVIEPVQVRTDAIESLLALEFSLTHPISKLREMGLLYTGKQPDDQYGLLIDLETRQGMSYSLGLNNFYVLTRYNRSSRYAMAVYLLAQRIAEKQALPAS